ncbi:uncharacterized protein LOC117315182 [Pecten maximus]|uniref:uncharacterized protein LOC117315182 n=1 Tax=Pecten maximus TaxID=6579 RepID=UPI00145896B2|nr:uncharacterized protein LOC117315182 [Pecten maximus]
MSDDKTEGPKTCLVFLGLEIDTVEMVVRVPLKKVEELCSLITQVLGKSKIKLADLQSFAGKVAFCARAIPSARAFCRRIYESMSGVKKAYHYIRLGANLKEDLRTLHKFFHSFNGVCYFPDREWLSNVSCELYTDSSGNSALGCGALFQKQWLVVKWSEFDFSAEVFRDITYLELIPIFLALFVWGQELQNKKVIFHCDNMALVEILNKKSSRSCRVMSLIRPLLLECMYHNVQFKAMHVPGVSNAKADALSRLQFHRFRELAQDSSQQACVIPQAFWTIFMQNSTD